VKVERSIYGVGLVCDCASMNINLSRQLNAMWIKTMELVESKGLIEEKLHVASSSIH